MWFDTMLNSGTERPNVSIKSPYLQGYANRLRNIQKASIFENFEPL